MTVKAVMVAPDETMLLLIAAREGLRRDRSLR